MDDIVKQAMAKWPNVPHCHGWLGLDARGNWFMRDDRAQLAGAFTSGQAGSKGSQLRHEKLIEFIQRNYACDGDGQWYFQNGPQRVYVELEITPIIWRIAVDLTVCSHHGHLARTDACLLDENGRLYLACHIQESPTIVLGVVHTQDMLQASDAIEQGLWLPIDVRSGLLERQYGYVRSPVARRHVAAQ